MYGGQLVTVGFVTTTLLRMVKYLDETNPLQIQVIQDKIFNVVVWLNLLLKYNLQNDIFTFKLGKY